MSLLTHSTSTIRSLYLAFYGRPADPAGLKFWAGQLDRADGDLGAILTPFIASAEAQVRFAGETVSGQIVRVYEQLFNREPDAEGLAFWVGAVEKGHITLANMSAMILQGARGNDSDLSQLRQQAAEAFTAQVEASGSAYDGYASIEAARVLVRAVTLDTKPADMAALVNAAAAFADVATRTPAVVEAIASGGSLLAMFDTPRGLAEPVALLQTLADTAKAAAGNPHTLDSLLRGGGMTKVLEVMPAEATLQDVADALVEGGLPAAVEVVYPSTPPVQPEPEPAPVDPTPADPDPTPVADTVPPAIERITVGPNDGVLSMRENVDLLVAFDAPVVVADGNAILKLANGGVAVYTGGSGTATLTFNYVPGAGQNTDAIKLAASAAFTGSIADLSGNALPATAFDGLSPAAAPAVDTEAPAQAITFTTITQSGGDSASVAGTGKPLATNLATATVHAVLSEELQAGQQLQYSLDNGRTWEVRNAYAIGDKVWIENVPTTEHATLMLRLVNDAGIAGPAASQAITYDAEGPQVGAMTFVRVTEGERDTQPDNVTNVAVVSAGLRIDGFQPGAGEQLQYSTDGERWTSTGLLFDEETGKLTIDNLALDQGAPGSDGNRVTTVSVRAIDAAGNTTSAGSQDLVYDDSAKAPVMALAKDTGISTTDKITYSGDVRISGLDSGSAWEYAFDGGTWVPGPGAVDGKATLTLSGEGEHTVLVRQYDAAGNASEKASLHFTLDTTKPAALPSFYHVEGATTVANATGLSTADVIFSYEGSFDAGDIVEYRSDIGNWTRSDSVLVDKDAHTITLQDVDLSASDPFIAVRVVDTAGNRGVEASATIDGPYGNIVFSTQVTPEGLAVTSSGDATLYLQTAPNTLTPVLSTAGGGAVGGGTVVVGAQSTISTGTLVLKSASGKLFADPSGTVYSFGTAGPATDTFSAPGTVLWGFGGPNVATAGDAGVRFHGGSGGNKLTGGAGNDVLIGGSGSNTLVGGAGDDVLVGGPATGPGSNTLDGGAGNDTLEAGTGTAGIVGGTGADTIILAKGKNTLMFNEGDSSIANGIDTVVFADTLAGNMNAQLFRFPASASALYRASGVANPVDGSDASVLSAFAGAYQAKAGLAANAAVLVEFANHDQYLILDTGDGMFDVNDHVVKLVGMVPEVSSAPIGLTFSPMAS